MSIDWTISIGNIVTTMVLVVTLAGIAIRFGQRFTSMERKVNIMFAWFLKQLDGHGGLTAAEVRRFFEES